MKKFPVMMMFILSTRFHGIFGLFRLLLFNHLINFLLCFSKVSYKPSLNKTYRFAFILITSLFFLWGFAKGLDPISIPHLKTSFTLTTTQSTFLDSAVFIAYSIMTLPAGFIMKRFGCKIGIITRLLLYVLGSFLFVPAADNQSYNFFMLALFIIACGLTILETAANRYASSLGDLEPATQRLIFSQSFNCLAAALTPIIGDKIIPAKGYSEVRLNGMTETANKLALTSKASSVKMIRNTSGDIQYRYFVPLGRFIVTRYLDGRGIG